MATLPAELVYAGFSNGGTSAEYLAATRAGAKGALLFHAALALPMFGQFAGETVSHWPSTVPVQVHYSVGDPFREQEELDSFAGSVKESGAAYALYEYPGNGHLFADESRAMEYDADAAELMWTRVCSFLETV